MRLEPSVRANKWIVSHGLAHSVILLYSRLFRSTKKSDKKFISQHNVTLSANTAATCHCVPKHVCYDGISRRMHNSFAINLPCSGTK